MNYQVYIMTGVASLMLSLIAIMISVVSILSIYYRYKKGLFIKSQRKILKCIFYIKDMSKIELVMITNSCKDIINLPQKFDNLLLELKEQSKNEQWFNIMRGWFTEQFVYESKQICFEFPFDVTSKNFFIIDCYVRYRFPFWYNYFFRNNNFEKFISEQTKCLNKKHSNTILEQQNEQQNIKLHTNCDYVNELIIYSGRKYTLLLDEERIKNEFFDCVIKYNLNTDSVAILQKYLGDIKELLWLKRNKSMNLFYKCFLYWKRTNQKKHIRFVSYPNFGNKTLLISDKLFLLLLGKSFKNNYVQEKIEGLNRIRFW